MTTIVQEINRFCANLGKEKLLVQGAGGNVSWKEGNQLWIKGSGTWLADAEKKNIFVPVDLDNLNKALSNKNFNCQPQLIGNHPFRPSIETILHALMPQKIVVHLHAIEILKFLVSNNYKETIRLLLKNPTLDFNFILVDYHKPGPDLAQAINQSLNNPINTNVVFLKNHGIVIGGESINEVVELLNYILSRCAKQHRANMDCNHSMALPTPSTQAQENYIAFPDIEVHQLALNVNLFKRLQSDWALYPDHVVFLGPNAFFYPSWENFLNQVSFFSEKPELIFIEKKGVFIKPNFNLAKSVQLRCYFDVISRVPPSSPLEPISRQAINELLEWDAEKLRQTMSK